MSRRPRPSPRDFVTNWSTYDASAVTKARLAAKNSLIKLRRASDCCGNHGEPGC